MPSLNIHLFTVHRHLPKTPCSQIRLGWTKVTNDKLTKSKKLLLRFVTRHCTLQKLADVYSRWAVGYQCLRFISVYEESLAVTSQPSHPHIDRSLLPFVVLFCTLIVQQHLNDYGIPEGSAMAVEPWSLNC